MDVTLVLSLFIFFVSTAVALLVSYGYRQLQSLESTPAISSHFPKVSIIFSALNEAATLEPALLSLLAIDYPQLEIIAINDRSTDATPDILNRIANHYPKLQIVHISELPPDWLGKNHALYRGAQQATGDYFIFTDADILFEKSCIARAVNYCETYDVDHLTLFFDLIAKSNLLRLMLVNFTVSLMARMQPWRVGTSKKHFIGIGGFNMVRRTAYHNSGGHRAIAMAVLDDVMLGKLLKTQGFKQDALTAMKLLSVEWYESAAAMIRGLQKNMFAAFNFQIHQLILLSLAMMLLRLWPWIGMVVTTDVARWVNIATLALNILLYAKILRSYNWGYGALWWMPVAGLIELYIWWRSCLITLWHGGIEWRGTFYPTKALKGFKLGIWG